MLIAQVFQDVPFSLPFTFEILDFSFPGAKFILSVRGSADEWYDSLIRFHTHIVGKGRTPNANDLKEFPYRQKGWIWDIQKVLYGIDEETLYDREIYKTHYIVHNETIIDYFRNRPEDLLVIDLSNSQAEGRLGAFLGAPGLRGFLPHLNRSR